MYIQQYNFTNTSWWFKSTNWPENLQAICLVLARFHSLQLGSEPRSEPELIFLERFSMYTVTNLHGCVACCELLANMWRRISRREHIDPLVCACSSPLHTVHGQSHARYVKRRKKKKEKKRKSSRKHLQKEETLQHHIFMYRRTLFSILPQMFVYIKGRALDY